MAVGCGHKSIVFFSKFQTKNKFANNYQFASYSLFCICNNVLSVIESGIFAVNISRKISTATITVSTNTGYLSHTHGCIAECFLISGTGSMKVLRKQ